MVLEQLDAADAVAGDPAAREHVLGKLFKRVGGAPVGSSSTPG